MELLPSIAVFLLLSCSLAAATVPAGTIERVSKQQILASIPPGGHAGPPVLFLTSPSGKYAAYFVRTHTAPGAGGLGADFCYVEVMAGGGKAAEGGEGGGAAGGASAWESECRPVSTVNTCTLLFSWHGLEVFDGSEEAAELGDGVVPGAGTGGLGDGYGIAPAAGGVGAVAPGAAYKSSRGAAHLVAIGAAVLVSAMAVGF
ncbi:hypothetical protein TRIUR3_32442 [Triticum urartu]|uniref:Uncharacterized protein n=1 Tax=Triticum urartu TaxID=4572 RepID=M8AEU2_TRIUA|nr:hypothetical protein TRIUR3_32442 [Triticum urartu]